MTVLLRTLALTCGLVGLASADPLDASSPMELATTRSQVGWGATMTPERATVTSEGGWSGAANAAQVRADVEAALGAGASVFAGTEYGGLSTTARPAVGVAYQLVDPRRASASLRLSLAYKAEGFAQPEGEVESVVVASRRFGGDSLRGMVAYGRDPEGRESDAELGASYLHLADSRFVVGGMARYRRALQLRTGEPVWEAIGGAVGGLALERARIELLVGSETVAYANVRSGVVGLLGIGVEL